jgi:hypothetical protein
MASSRPPVDIKSLELIFDEIKKDLLEEHKRYNTEFLSKQYFENKKRFEIAIPMMPGKEYPNLLQVTALFLLLLANYGPRVNVDLIKEKDGITWDSSNAWKKFVLDTKDLKGKGDLFLHLIS